MRQKKSTWTEEIKQYHVGDIVYKKIFRYDNNFFYFTLGENLSTTISKNFFKSKMNNCDKDFFIGKYYWLEITNIDYEKQKICSKIKFNMSQETAFEYIKSNYNEDDIIYNVPLKKEEENFNLVEILPGYTAICYDKERHIKQGQLINVQIQSFNGSKKHITVKYYKTTFSDYIRKQIMTDSIDEPIVSHTVVKEIIERSKTKDDEETIKENIKKQYYDSFKNNDVLINKAGKETKITFQINYIDDNQINIDCGGKLSEKENKFILNFAGVSSVYAMTKFNRFAEINWETAMKELSELVLKGEIWEFSSDKPFSILTKYMQMTFYKVCLDKKLVFNEEDNFAVFDTGLVDDLYHPIYCCFSRRKNQSVYPKWKFEYFSTKESQLGQDMLKRLDSDLPTKVKYIKNINDIFYDTSKELHINYEHIINDNLSRIPIEYLYHQLYDNEVKKLYELYTNSIGTNKEKTNKANFENHIINAPELKRILINRLKDAVELSKQRCEWNYKTAIPIYYVITNKVSLLLPLSLNNTNNKDDIALVVEDSGNNYLGKTIITLDMAYNDARLICRPNSEWLTPEKISSSNNNDEIEFD